jgi:hypothetical protein
MFRFLFLAAVALIPAGCDNQAADLLQSGKVVGLFGLEGRWAGPVTPIANNCGQATEGLMTVGRKTFSFDPFQGTTVINGEISPVAHFDGSFSRAISGQKPVSISFTGVALHRDDGAMTIEGELTSGHCSWSVSMKRA